MSIDITNVTDAFAQYKAYVNALCEKCTQPNHLADQMGRTIERVDELLPYYAQWSQNQKVSFAEHIEKRGPDGLSVLYLVNCFGALTGLSRSIRMTLENKGIVLVDRFLTEHGEFRPL